MYKPMLTHTISVSCEQHTVHKPALTHTIIVFLWMKYSIQACAHPYYLCFPVNKIQRTDMCSPIPLLFSCEWNTVYKPVLTHTIIVFLWTKYSIQACTHPSYHCFPVNIIQHKSVHSPIHEEQSHNCRQVVCWHVGWDLEDEQNHHTHEGRDHIVGLKHSHDSIQKVLFAVRNTTTINDK